MWDIWQFLSINICKKLLIKRGESKVVIKLFLDKSTNVKFSLLSNNLLSNEVCSNRLSEKSIIEMCFSFTNANMSIWAIEFRERLKFVIFFKFSKLSLSITPMLFPLKFNISTLFAMLMFVEINWWSLKKYKNSEF